MKRSTLSSLPQKNELQKKGLIVIPGILHPTNTVPQVLPCPHLRGESLSRKQLSFLVGLVQNESEWDQISNLG